jgi:hypothetical protein
MANAWTPTPYGYSPVYWISVAGLPVIFTERALGLTLPTDIATEDGALVIDDSAEVGVERIDRDRGIGAGLDLTVKLLDTATVRDYMRRWTLSATLTTDLAVGGATVYVDDTTGWPASGEIHIGTERITYSSKTGTTFVVDSRATAGSLANAYDVGTTGPNHHQPPALLARPRGRAVGYDGVAVWALQRRGDGRRRLGAVVARAHHVRSRPRARRVHPRLSVHRPAA